MNNAEKIEYVQLLNSNRRKKVDQSRFCELGKMWIEEKVGNALERYSIAELLDVAIGLTPEDERAEIAKDVLDITKWIPGHSKYITVRCDTMNQVTALENFVASNIHTTFNEQKQKLF